MTTHDAELVAGSPAAGRAPRRPLGRGFPLLLSLSALVLVSGSAVMTVREMRWLSQRTETGPADGLLLVFWLFLDVGVLVLGVAAVGIFGFTSKRTRSGATDRVVVAGMTAAAIATLGAIGLISWTGGWPFVLSLLPGVGY